MHAVRAIAQALSFRERDSITFHRGCGASRAENEYCIPSCVQISAEVMLTAQM